MVLKVIEAKGKGKAIPKLLQDAHMGELCVCCFPSYRDLVLEALLFLFLAELAEVGSRHMGELLGVNLDGDVPCLVYKLAVAPPHLRAGSPKSPT